MSLAYDQFTRSAIERRLRLKRQAEQFAAVRRERERTVLLAPTVQPTTPIIGVIGYKKEYPFVADIIAMVSLHTGISKDEIISDRRQKATIAARHMVCYLAKELTPLSFPAIGYWMGGRDHTTILHAVNKMNAIVAANEEVRSLAEKLKERILQDHAAPYYGA